MPFAGKCPHRCSGGYYQSRSIVDDEKKVLPVVTESVQPPVGQKKARKWRNHRRVWRHRRWQSRPRLGLRVMSKVRPQRGEAIWGDGLWYLAGDMPENGWKVTKRSSGKCKSRATIVATAEVGASHKWKISAKGFNLVVGLNRVSSPVPKNALGR